MNNTDTIAKPVFLKNSCTAQIVPFKFPGISATMLGLGTAAALICALVVAVREWLRLRGTVHVGESSKFGFGASVAVAAFVALWATAAISGQGRSERERDTDPTGSWHAHQRPRE